MPLKIRGVDHGGWGVLPPLKILEHASTPKMSHSFTQNRCWTTLQAQQYEGRRMKDLCQKWKAKLIFRGIWNSLMAWPDWPWPSLIFKTYLRCCLKCRQSVTMHSITTDRHNWQNKLQYRAQHGLCWRAIKTAEQGSKAYVHVVLVSNIRISNSELRWIGDPCPCPF